MAQPSRTLSKRFLTYGKPKGRFISGKAVADLDGVGSTIFHNLAGEDGAHHSESEQDCRVLRPSDLCKHHLISGKQQTDMCWSPESEGQQSQPNTGRHKHANNFLLIPANSEGTVPDLPLSKASQATLGGC